MFQEVTTEHREAQRERQRADIEAWPRDEGEYRGFKWLMIRPHGSFWCGYVEVGHAHAFLEQDKDHFENFESRAHFGITGSHGTMTGFDCSHYTDFHTSVYETELPESIRDFCIDNNAMYKDHEYVLSRIRDMIDYLADNCAVVNEASEASEAESSESSLAE